MAKYLISFPSAAMVVPQDELEEVGHAARAVIEETKAAGVYVFAGGINESVPPVLVSRAVHAMPPGWPANAGGRRRYPIRLPSWRSHTHTCFEMAGMPTTPSTAERIEPFTSKSVGRAVCIS